MDQPHRNVNQKHKDSLTKLETVALFITEHVGSMGFFLIIFGWTIFWLGWNLVAPAHLRFDPPTGFVLWLFISNLIQIMLMPLIMVGQNLQSRHAEMRAEHDFEVDSKAEREICTLLKEVRELKTQVSSLEELLKSR
ncbi:MAG: DUF1003 domain-containing protein [Armatimonadetes bacterium]|nr:DUF1003 domain-containing protein [Armatimonadota bacterium]